MVTTSSTASEEPRCDRFSGAGGLLLLQLELLLENINAEEEEPTLDAKQNFEKWTKLDRFSWFSAKKKITTLNFD